MPAPRTAWRPSGSSSTRPGGRRRRRRRAGGDGGGEFGQHRMTSGDRRPRWSSISAVHAARRGDHRVGRRCRGAFGERADVGVVARARPREPLAHGRLPPMHELPHLGERPVLGHAYGAGASCPAPRRSRRPTVRRHPQQHDLAQRSPATGPAAPWRPRPGSLERPRSSGVGCIVGRLGQVAGRDRVPAQGPAGVRDLAGSDAIDERLERACRGPDTGVAHESTAMQISWATSSAR